MRYKRRSTYTTQEKHTEKAASSSSIHGVVALLCYQQSYNSMKMKKQEGVLGHKKRRETRRAAEYTN